MWMAFEAASRCRNELLEQGLNVRVTCDPEDVTSSIVSIGKPYLSKWLDPTQNDFTEKNYFWLIAENDNAPQIVGGGRLDDFSFCASRHLENMFRRGYGSDVVDGVCDSCNIALQGRALYLGDLFAKPRGTLGRRAVRYFLCLAHYLAVSHFQADVVYSFFSRKDVLRGSADVNGFTDRILTPATWRSVPEYMDTNGVLAFRRNDQSQAYFETITQELAHTE